MALEVFQDGRIRMYGSTVQPTPKSLPSYEEAVKIAGDWLTYNDLYPAHVSRVEKGGNLTAQNSVTGEITSYWVVVKFMTKLGDIDIYSPGALVCVGENGKIMQAEINMTQLKEYETVKLKTPEAALDILKAYLASPLADPAEARECLINLRNFERLTVTRITLQYTPGSGYLQPIYVFQGNAYSQNNPNLDVFIGKVDAVSR
jgi:hypothetical protein